MAQQAVLRVHADLRNRRTVIFHPMCHLEQHEEQAYQRLHGLVGRPAGGRDRLITLADLTEIAEPPAALLLELPQRDIGGQQPDWDDLAAQVSWARERGAAAHLDGARLWESAAGYGRSPAEIAGLFDTVYVSFYKGIGALAGCCAAGPEDVIAQVRDWRRRMGGTLYGLWPNAASALSCLAERLPKFPGYTAHARAIGAELAALPGVTVVPDPPQVPMMHLLLRTGADAYADAARKLAGASGYRRHPCRPPTLACSGSNSRWAMPPWGSSRPRWPRSSRASPGTDRRIPVRRGTGQIVITTTPMNERVSCTSDPPWCGCGFAAMNMPHTPPVMSSSRPASAAACTASPVRMSQKPTPSSAIVSSHRWGIPTAASVLIDRETASKGTGWMSAATVQPPISSAGASVDDTTPHHGIRT
jgi:threonine aldolase